MNKVDLEQLVDNNQIIKVVPSVEETLRFTGLNTDLDYNIHLWFDQLKLTWKTWKKSATVENHIETFFYSVPDPHRVALVFIIKSPDSKDCKPKTLPFFIIETLLKWSNENGVMPEDDLKLPAFRIAVQQRNQHFLNLMMKTYHVVSIKETVLPMIRDMIKHDNARQASQILIALELFEDIPVEDVIFPLVLQDKANMIDEYLSECPAQVKRFLEFLDQMLAKKFNIREYVQKYLEENTVSHIRYEKLHYKPLGKLVARLCNKFNVPIETCKNLSKNRTTGGLKYLIYQKYQENNVSLAVWDDLVKDSLRQNAGSGKDFIDMLVDYDRNEALKWANYLQMPETELPLALKNLSLQDNNDEPESWDTSEISTPTQDFYKFSLSYDQVIMIDTAEKFYDFMSNLLQTNVASIDCEWKPSFGATQSQVALMQIAILNKVYLIDTLILNHPNYQSFWYTFHKSFLDNAEIIKVGFGLEQDLKEMKASIIALSNIKVKGEGLLDLCILWKNLVESGLSLPSNSDSGGNSLSSLVQSCFGLPLEKSEQCSNWELRPLRSTQITYAALDAYVLLEIYYFLQKKCQEQDINFEDICNDVMLEGKKKCSKKPKSLDKIQSAESSKVFLANDIKFLVEPTISHLMPYLRYCGIDTVVMPIRMLWHEAINVAISEDYHILLEKIKYTPIANFPQSSILDVGKGSAKNQLLKIFVNFNVQIKDDDYFSRCFNCNSKEIKKLQPNKVKNICQQYHNVGRLHTQNRNQIDSDDDDGLDFSKFLSDSDDEHQHLQPVQCYTNKDCYTSKGVVIEISNVQKLQESQKPAILCEDCGKLFWDEDPLLQSVRKVISSVNDQLYDKD